VRSASRLILDMPGPTEISWYAWGGGVFAHCEHLGACYDT
jgi:hypothetical protein